MLNAEKQKLVVNVDYFLPPHSKPPIIDLHFPDALHAFVWRNWESVSAERMANVVGTTAENIRQTGLSMGLPADIEPVGDFLTRGYVTIIRHNWHLLPEEQIIALLGWTREKYDFHMKEDDFLFIKLGHVKPVCNPLKYIAPNEASRKRCAEIKSIVLSAFGDGLVKSAEPRFAFIEKISTPDKNVTTINSSTDKDEQLRFMYSYFAPYGDPLLNPQLDPFPEGLLQKLAESGVNGVWLHVVLRQLSPPIKLFPEFGVDHETRLKNLNQMVQRAARYGVKIYLYISEPRAMPPSFFEGRDHLKGSPIRDYYSICTSLPEVREWVTDSLAYVFKEVPGLGGVFTISKCENPTNCFSDCLSLKAENCPRCSKRTGPEVIAEINTAIANGVWKGNPDAKVICWDWMWPEQWIEDIISKLPPKVYYQTVSEWGKKIVRSGWETVVNEYSMSGVGPSERAKSRWAIAKKYGLKTSAKVQVNVTWEMSTLPYLPVMNLVAEHCSNLAQEDINSLMLSWSLGGSPSPNLRLVQAFSRRPAPTMQEALSETAIEYYGPEAAPYVLEAWKKFSDAFAQYPYSRPALYLCPVHLGPANLLYPAPTGYNATMVGFSYDDLESWQAYNPGNLFTDQFEKMASMWHDGLAVFEKVLTKTKTPQQQENGETDFRIAEAAYIHFKSVFNQARFTAVRNRLLEKEIDQNEKEEKFKILKESSSDEMNLAKRLYTLANEDSRFGFEASNQYHYLPLDLVEKVVNCRYILDNWLPQQILKEEK